MTHKLHLPAIHSNAPVTPRMSPNAIAFAVAWMEALDERAEYMLLDDRLVTAAQNHAIYLDSRTGDELLQSMHRGRDGSYSNQRALEAGFRLPSEYSANANNIESCARNGGGPQAALTGLLNSDNHRPHLLGENGFADRTHYGVGNVGDDYVALACPPEEAI